MGENVIYIVSGLPRSGTSMLMQMLEAGGLEIMTDKKRASDEDNPKGYYEDARVNSLDRDNSWVGEAKGVVLKVVSPLLKHLPGTQKYKIVFVQREIAEVLASQRKMMQRRGEKDDVDDALMTRVFQKSLDDADEWMRESANVDFLYVKHRDIISRPAEEASKVNLFLGSILDEVAMGSVVDAKLYRQRAD
jgi:hypothetical protein